AAADQRRARRHRRGTHPAELAAQHDHRRRDGAPRTAPSRPDPPPPTTTAPVEPPRSGRWRSPPLRGLPPPYPHHARVAGAPLLRARRPVVVHTTLPSSGRLSAKTPPAPP